MNHAATRKVAARDYSFESEENAQMSGLNKTGKNRKSRKTGGKSRQKRAVDGIPDFCLSRRGFGHADLVINPAELKV